MKYRAKEDLPPNVKAGDIVEIDGPLIPEFVSKFELVSDGEDKTLVGNPSRTELKARAEELGINFAPNIPTDRLMELVAEAEDKLKQAGDGGDKGEDEGDKD